MINATEKVMERCFKRAGLARSSEKNGRAWPDPFYGSGRGDCVFNVGQRQSATWMLEPDSLEHSNLKKAGR